MHVSALSLYLVSVCSEFESLKFGCPLIHFWGLCPITFHFLAAIINTPAFS